MDIFSTASKNIQRFIALPLWRDFRFLSIFWLALGAIAWVTKVGHSLNNFLIFRFTFWHAIAQQPLYTEYPAEYFDTNHYGPFFSLLVAPFAYPPAWLGLLLWELMLALLLWVAIRRSTLNSYQQIFVYWFCAHELLTALFMSQFNIAIAALMVLAFTMIEKEKDGWAAFFIILGAFVKIYTLAGLAFFFFSKHKLRFILSLIGWSVVMFVAPMVISSPEYIIDQYQAWKVSLTEKNALNMFAQGQNISLLGIAHRWSGCYTFSDLWLIIPGMIAFCAPYLRIKQWKNSLAFRQMFLASALMFILLFSSGSESSGYIIALIGVVIWYACVPWKRNKWDIALMVFAFILCSMSPSDLMPKYLREEWIKPYALKALPCVIIWFKLCWEMCTKEYSLTHPSPKGEG